MLAVKSTILAILLFPITIPWLIWVLVVWTLLKHRYTKAGANMISMAWNPYAENHSKLSELLKFIIWPYGIASRTYSLIKFLKTWEEAK